MKVLWIMLCLAGIVVGEAGCGGNDRGGAPASPATTQMSPGVASTLASPVPGSSSTASTTVFVDPPPYTNPPAPVARPIRVPVERRALLERRAAEFELLDPRRDPRRYLAMSASDCKEVADEEEIRKTGTARGGGYLNEAEARRLTLLERGTRVVDIDVFGYLRDQAQVGVRLDGDPPQGSGRIREWILENGDWHVGSCYQ